MLHLKSTKKVMVNPRTLQKSYVHMIIDGVTQNADGIAVFGQYYEETETGLKPLLPGFNHPISNEQVNTIAEEVWTSNAPEIERRNLQLAYGTIKILDQLKIYGLDGNEWVQVNDL